MADDGERARDRAENTAERDAIHAARNELQRIIPDLEARLARACDEAIQRAIPKGIADAFDVEQPNFRKWRTDLRDAVDAYLRSQERAGLLQSTFLAETVKGLVIVVGTALSVYFGIKMGTH